MCRTFEQSSTVILNGQCSKILHGADMSPVGPKLKALRLRAVPPLSIRRAAEKLEMGHSSYNFYENPNSYKKSHLPLDFARKVAAMLAEYGVDPAEVMMLAGLNESEAEPEARAIEAAKPAVQYVTLSVAFPSEDALADMFQSLLALVPADATRAEAARILAQRLPAGFAAIGPVAPDQGKAPMIAPAEAARSLATDRP
ncbi:XRE family transcriptional regulator [Sphingobium sp. B2D3C]|uniref:XRE family transcriptional regulator n=1 Tax=Sphingobium sp. B2D3C TaxID=2940581 RepID=UPI002223F678|nr:XRE family transcriptional regulator [Sphingobium sp. B2D3C]MCW2399674.1 hypothetical protein [Sphingobium sp. B2D3C]